MSATLRDLQLIELCTQSIQYDRQVQAACSAFDEQMHEIIDDTGPPVPSPMLGSQAFITFIPLILSLANETLVDILAWQFHVDFYDPAKPLAFKRNLVQKSITWHMRKGTVALLQEVLDTFWPGGASITEWYEYDDPLPPNYPIVDPDALIGSLVPANVNVATNTLTKNAHGLNNDDQVHFELTAGGSAPSPTAPAITSPALPAPLLPSILYRVVNKTTNTFQVAVSLGGAPIDLTTAGNGTFYLYRKGTGSWHDRYRFRIIIDEHIILPEDEAQVLALVNAYKPVSRWLEGIFRTTASQCDIGWYGACLRFDIIASDAPDYDFGAAIPTPPIAATVDLTFAGVDMTGFSIDSPNGTYTIPYREDLSDEDVTQWYAENLPVVGSAPLHTVLQNVWVKKFADGSWQVGANFQSDINHQSFIGNGTTMPIANTIVPPTGPNGTATVATPTPI